MADSVLDGLRMRNRGERGQRLVPVGPLCDYSFAEQPLAGQVTRHELQQLRRERVQLLGQQSAKAHVGAARKAAEQQKKVGEARHTLQTPRTLRRR
jgi:hypothetical protein